MQHERQKTAGRKEVEVTAKQKKTKSAEELISDMSAVSDALIETVDHDVSKAKGARKRRLLNALTCLSNADIHIKRAVEKVK